MDPSEDPDDILRANRSQEKTFVFDMVFGHRATQVTSFPFLPKGLILEPFSLLRWMFLAGE